jgi:hypothetical protein
MGSDPETGGPFVTKSPGPTIVLIALSALPSLASAQIIESVGERALGMGGAFVGVADDSTATWWNPAGLAAGPFFDLAVGGAGTEIDAGFPARRERGTWFSLATLPFGVSYYRLRVTDIAEARTIGASASDREEKSAVVTDWSLSAGQLGATLVHTVASGIHVGTTLKYVWAKGLVEELTGPASSRVSEWLDLADDASGGAVHHNFDLDLGILAVRGPLRIGGLVRNVRETDVGAVKIPRQGRVGIAFDASQISSRTLLVAVDADLGAYQTPFGDRRVIAVGAEGWAAGRRLGIRAGARFNTTGAGEQAYTAGASVAVRSGVFVDGHVGYGGTDAEGGWGISARASF